MTEPSKGQAIRLAYLISQYPAYNHTFILREVRALRAKGLDISTMSVAAPDRPYEKLLEMEREEFDRTFYVKSAGAGHIVGALMRVLFGRPAGFVKGLAAAIRLAGWSPGRVAHYVAYFVESVVVADHMLRHRLTHVHTHFSSTVTLILGYVAPVGVSVTFHGSAEFNEPTLFHLSEKVEAARFVCAISSYGRSQLMVASAPEQWSKIEVAPLGVDTSLFAPVPVRETPRPFELLCVGQLAPAKAHGILISAVRKLVSAGHAVRLTLIGDGPYRPSLERLVSELGLEEQVVFMGSQAQDVVRAQYRSTDIFTLASFKEGVPVVLMEAMACGVPCVATGITGIPELIEHGVHGLLVPPSDVDAFADAIVTLMNDGALRARLAANARQRILARYEITRNSERMRDVFVRRLGSARR